MIDPPYIWFGGKRKAAPLVWDALGDVDYYVEPFFGGGAVWLARPHEPRLETVNDIDGFVCLAPETRVLSADWRWTSIGDLRVGDAVVAFDEHNGPARQGCVTPTSYRKWAVGSVTACKRVKRPCYRLVFDDGTSVVASEDHQWLGDSHRTGGRGWRWQSTKTLVCNRKTQRSWVMKAVDVIAPDTSWDAGWMAGFYDGEDNLRLSNGKSGWAINITQRLGPELDTLKRLLVEHGFSFTERIRKPKSANHSVVSSVTITGGMSESMRFAMTFRPSRLLESMTACLPYASLYGREKHAVGLVEKTYLGECEVVAVETSTRTFIAEGLASHNCNFWRAVQHEPEAVAEAMNWPVNEVDLDARHRYLCLMPDKEVFLARMKTDPDHYDVKRAAWWCWGLNAWIGGGWCGGEYWPDEPGASKGVGVCDGANKRPHLGMSLGVHRKLPQEGDTQQGEYARRGQVLRDWMTALRDRLRNVRVCRGDWQRICTDGVTSHGRVVGVFLDPPYHGDTNRDKNIYRCEDLTVSERVRKWCMGRTDNERYRIVLAGYEGEHDGLDPLGWRVVSWKANGGYANRGKQAQGKINAGHERLWFSPSCLSQEYDLFW